MGLDGEDGDPLAGESASMFELALESASTLVYVSDVATGAVLQMFGAQRLLGLDDEALPDRASWMARVHPDDLPRCIQSIEEHGASGGDLTLEYRVRRADGTHRWVHERMRILAATARAPERHAGVVSDIHERKLAELALIDLNRRRDEHLAMLGHELRNPLAAIRHAVEVLTLEPANRRALGVLDRQSSTMSRLLDDLLDVARLTREKPSMQLEEVDLAALVRDGFERRRLDAKPGVRTTLHVEREPAIVRADLVRLTQVVENLLDNALRFTHEGEIAVSLDERGDAWLLTVRDTGIGFVSEHAERLFDPFHQEAQTLERSYGGLGLGLTLVEAVIRRLGGRVRASSDGPGCGATFEITLPQASMSRST